MVKKSLCLCYAPKCGLYTKYLEQDAESENIVIRAYDKIGFHESSFIVPNTNFTITIKSNFNYCKASYLFAYITNEGKELIDADVNKLRVLNQCNLNQFTVASEDWQSLFDKIINAYKDIDGHAALASLSIYVDEISKILSLESVHVKAAMHQSGTALWNKNLLFILIGKKIEDLLYSIKKIENENLLKRSLDLCNKFCTTLQKELIFDELDDSHKKQLSARLLTIHKFLEENGDGVKFLEWFVR